MKIAFVSIGDPFDVKLWSGTISHIAQELKLQKKDTQFIELKVYRNWLLVIIKLLYKIIGKRFEIERTDYAARYYNYQLLSKVDSDVDIILAPSTLPFLKYEGDIPYGIYLDAIFETMCEYYPLAYNYTASIRKEYCDKERFVFDKARCLFFASNWALESYLKYYDKSCLNTFIVPFGANIRFNYKEINGQLSYKNKDFDVCNFLFVGVDWERKGGVFVLETLKILKRDGFKVHLHIVGLKEKVEGLENIDYTWYGFLNKNNPEDIVVLQQLYEQCLFLFVPSVAEAFGIVYLEASSVALPSIARDTGGVSDAVLNGKNGILLKKTDKPNDCAKLIVKYIEDKSAYFELSESALIFYRQNRTWQLSINTIVEILESCYK